jgi:hypothetical protein
MAKKQKSRVVPLVILLGILAGAGTWNYRRNVKLEEEVPRPYRSYSLEDLENLKAAYQAEVDAHTARYRAASGRKVAVRDGGLIGDQVSEFERVQRISQGKRAIASQFAKNQVQLEGVLAEISQRASEREPWRVFLNRLTKYP